MQARVRAGESAEAVAADTGWELDKVLRYAEPLLAERSFMANQAQAVEVRRSGGSVTLYDACEQVLGEAATDALVWDAHRREDGRWVVTATSSDSAASWTYDHHGRNLHPLDDAARRLLGAAPTAPVEDIDIAEALDLVAEVPVVREAADLRPRLAVVPDTEDALDETLDEVVSSSDGDENADAEPVSLSGGYQQETIALPRTVDSAPAAEQAGEASKGADQQAPAQRGTRKPKPRKGRTSVPSWDEILFGAGRADD